ncbi:FAD/NAD(P)-binding domain-containing protein [Gymnopus androsaceus JB14]|uniref:FAD/NAD(P)-binding domain-containing protein n=1 Tax=Gymnopus androsaceus JB14 TaxID=1447944 RepID=A0A6A4HVV4_9AGAR|nr:FAD/NAD(P)-binding domain-containing protein [Gymnopus androsaceus JB14]
MSRGYRWRSSRIGNSANLVERGQFEKVVLVERRDDVGGVWYRDEPVITSNNTNTINKPRWPSPAYPGLVGNVLPQFLSFSENPFPKTPNHPHQPFPSLAETYQYLRAFAEPYIEKGQIRLSTEVVRVEELPQKKGWKVRVKDWSESENNEGVPLEVEEIWDGSFIYLSPPLFTVWRICAGYYDKPLWPDTEGLDVVRKRGLASHAKWWNGPDGYEGKRALVIGNAHSSNDIASQLAPVAQSPVYRSMRRPASPWFPSLPDSRIQNVGSVRKYILQPADEDKANGKVTAVLQDGSEIKDIDIVILGTGYCPHP